MYNNSKIKAFAEVDSHDAKVQFESKIIKHIEGESKEYILSIDENDYIEYLINEYSLEPLVIYQESEMINQPKIIKEKFTDNYREHIYEKDVYYFNIHYQYVGSEVLFKIRPSQWVMKTCEIKLIESAKEVVLSLKITEQDAEKFNNEKTNVYKAAFDNLENVNVFANEWNKSVVLIVNRTFKQVKEKFLKENNFFSAINISTNPNTESVFTVPTIKKISIPQPKVDKNKEFSSAPSMPQTIYSDIIKVIYDAGKSMEKKPALYIGKNEEGLRDQFLFILETRYESITATGETFNKKGKTDIILKYAGDNSNVFVAECKFWHGLVEFHKSINQLFDRYLTWRDSKVALIFFVSNKDFSNTLTVVEQECVKHEYYVQSNGKNGESSFSYIFSLPNDKDKTVFLELIFFHFDQKNKSLN